MPLHPIYEGDIFVIQLERDQRRQMEQRRGQLSRKIDHLNQLVEKAKGDENVGKSNSSTDSSRGDDN